MPLHWVAVEVLMTLKCSDSVSWSSLDLGLAGDTGEYVRVFFACPLSFHILSGIHFVVKNWLSEFILHITTFLCFLYLNHFLKSRGISELCWNILKNTNTIFLQSSRYVCNKQPCLKTTGLNNDLLLLTSLFLFLYFIFSSPISFSLCFTISPSLLFFWYFFKPLSSVVKKLLYTYI